MCVCVCVSIVRAPFPSSFAQMMSEKFKCVNAAENDFAVDFQKDIENSTSVKTR